MTSRSLALAFPLLIVGAALVAPANAQIVNPADKQRQEPTPPAGQGEPVVVEGKQVSPLREEDRVGPYGQPVWTVHRRFPETRVYVRPPGQVEFEYWMVPQVPEHGPTEIEHQYEVEFGLPHRLQLDLYLVSHQLGNQGPLDFDEQKVEVRYALADWDEIWGNPTLYLEWAAKDQAPDAVEGKLLLGGEITTGWHWGSNFVFEAETGGLHERNYEYTGGISKTLCDQELAVGAELKAAFADDSSDRGSFSSEVLLGPSFQYWPAPNAHLDIAPLAGLTDDAPDFKLLLVFGWAF